ncbi:MAG: ATP-binding protein [Gammaproteobacteria bacterium]
MATDPVKQQATKGRRARQTIRSDAIGLWPLIGLGLLGLSFYLLGVATENTALFGSLYTLLLVLNVAGLVLLTGLIVANVVSLIRQYRAKVIGSHLRLRLVVMFVFLSITPVSGVYYYSLQFLHEGIESWFDVRIENALKDALELSRSSLELRMRELLRELSRESSSLTAETDALAGLVLDEIRDRTGAREVTLIAQNGTIVGFASAERAQVVPDQPDETVIAQVRSGQDYAALDPVKGDALNARIAVAVPHGGGFRILQAIYPMPKHVSDYAANVEEAITGYKELAYLRTPLKFTFTLTLSLVLLLSLAFAVWAAFFASRRLAAPIQHLAEGTRAVAGGDYSKRLPLPGDDELGQLVQSFNSMTLNIALARDSAARSQREAEAQRAYLEALLARLSSGVISLDGARVVRMVNAAASGILGPDLSRFVGWPLSALKDAGSPMPTFIDRVEEAIATGREEWRAEIELDTEGHRLVLLSRGARLAGEGGRAEGYVVVFDDVTTIVQAQRDAAWAEVARRMAHEIKNPLTPIQLSAERLRHKCLGSLEGKQAEVFDRSTKTIVQQVEAMKAMVNAFNQYARPPKLELFPLDLNVLVEDLTAMYGPGHDNAQVHLDLGENLPMVTADADRLRQVMHNLLANAFDATDGQPDAVVEISTRLIRGKGRLQVQVGFADNGPGIDPDLMPRLFEPYVTNKAKGTGLGLAIVKKIIEEHGGIIRAEAREGGGAFITFRIPARPDAASDTQDTGTPAPP